MPEHIIPRSPLTGRRASKLGDEMARAKIERARKMTPEQRLLLAIELSDAMLRITSELDKNRAERESPRQVLQTGEGRNQSRPDRT